jgi:DNA-binding protein Fis
MRSSRLHIMIATLVIVSHIALTSVCLAQADQPSQRERESIEQCLRNYLREPLAGEDKTARYVVALVDLEENGTLDAIVYLTGQHLCGSGGCDTLILAPDGASYRVVTDISITRPPIRC